MDDLKQDVENRLLLAQDYNDDCTIITIDDVITAVDSLKHGQRDGFHDFIDLTFSCVLVRICIFILHFCFLVLLPMA